MQEAVIVSSKRTALGKSYRGSFNMTRPDDLAAHAIRAALDAVPEIADGDIADVLIGCGLPEGPSGHNVGRIAALRSGLPSSVPGVTVNRFCSSGLQTIAMAAHSIQVGSVTAVIAGGTESISLVQNDKLRVSDLHNQALLETWPDAYMSMGETAEVVAKRYGISRRAQDEYAAQSQARVAEGQEKGLFDDCIAPMTVTRGIKLEDGSFGTEDGVVVAKDECNRPGTTVEGLSGLKPVFAEDGSVTAGNASQFSDGASATVLTSASNAANLGLDVLGTFKGFQVAGVDPDEMGIGPVYAVPKLLGKAGLTLDDIDIIELNEAFASQVLYCQRELGIPDEKLNPLGGSISIGHPYGMTGSRMVGQLLRHLKRTGGRYGITTMCVGGGMGAAGLFEVA
ncbi:3-ketoacyl-CoA thiolase @ Acetyl-CoA acetyltransferase [hydrothermal vent metagenome]|uniref:acetyl-CoA C-acyltransferase n=1 Tax=hydrothermal vent metagenome TaxID=652676 RepID=A0A3B0TR26_9ZZZZ